VNDASVVPENYEHAFSSRRLSLGFFSFWEKWATDIQVTGFSILGRNDASNFRPSVTILYIKSLPLISLTGSKLMFNFSVMAV
jgi:hypothetical protein